MEKTGHPESGGSGWTWDRVGGSVLQFVRRRSGVLIAILVASIASMWFGRISDEPEKEKMRAAHKQEADKLKEEIDRLRSEMVTLTTKNGTTFTIPPGALVNGLRRTENGSGKD